MTIWLYTGNYRKEVWTLTSVVAANMATTNTAIDPKCVASTNNTFCKSVRESDKLWRNAPRNHGRDHGSESNFFREAQFSPDGTSIVTQSEDHSLRTFILPTDLLDEEHQPHHLNEYAVGPASGNIQAFATHPGFDLRDSSTTVVLSAVSDQPISLRNALDYSFTYAVYYSISPTTEVYLPSTSLAFTGDGRRFIAGSSNLISVFDCSRSGEGPITRHATAESRKSRQLYGAASMSCRGRISALSISSSGILAAGSTEREVALYGNGGQGECITAFSIAQHPDGSSPSGTGVTGLGWSPCDQYVLIAERQSECIQVYDVRNALSRVACLTGRKADSTQKLGFDIVPTSEGCEVWAGGTDGVVKMWRNPGRWGHEQAPEGEMKLHEGTPEELRPCEICLQADLVLLRLDCKRCMAPDQRDTRYLLRPAF